MLQLAEAGHGTWLKSAAHKLPWHAIPQAVLVESHAHSGPLRLAAAGPGGRRMISDPLNIQCSCQWV